jgi:hypothetical protein
MVGAKEKRMCSVLRSLVHPLLIAVLLLWPPILIYRSGLVPSLPVIAGHYWNTHSLISIEDWFLRVLPSALPVLGLIAVTLMILREQI